MGVKVVRDVRRLKHTRLPVWSVTAGSSEGHLSVRPPSWTSSFFERMKSFLFLGPGSWYHADPVEFQSTI